ncbi:MAG: efflux RND transporter periplasmic adaptor subunit [Flavobacteriaceae bacterium]|nr:efflux RND transporter periplasmic adaptor subunit [Flavobacteriaceae bacterium]
MNKILITLFSLSLLISCSTAVEETNNSRNTEENIFQIRLNDSLKTEDMLTRIKVDSFPEIISVRGRIDLPPDHKHSIRPFIGGKIVQLPIIEGTQVKKGQLLAAIESPEYIELQKQYLDLYHKIAFLENEYLRQKQLFEENISSQKVMLQAESTFKSAQSNLSGLRQNLQLIGLNMNELHNGNISANFILTAPASGYIASLDAILGQFIESKTELMQLIDPRHWHIELEVYERDMQFVKIGQKVRFKVPELSEKYFYGEVHLINPIIKAETRTFGIHVHPDEDFPSKFKAVGNFVEAEIEGVIRSVFVLPESAIVKENEKNTIFVLKRNTEAVLTFIPTTIKTGNTINNLIEIDNPDQSMLEVQILQHPKYIMDE